MSRPVPLVLCLCSLLATVSGCSRYTGLRHLVHTQARGTFRCSEDKTTVVPLNRNTFRAEGCGQRALYQCHRWNKDCANLTRHATRRAVLEFGCPPEDVQVLQLAPYVFQVRACGRQANYRCEMRSGIAGCEAEVAARP